MVAVIGCGLDERNREGRGGSIFLLASSEGRLITRTTFTSCSLRSPREHSNRTRYNLRHGDGNLQLPITNTRRSPGSGFKPRLTQKPRSLHPIWKPAKARKCVQGRCGFPARFILIIRALFGRVLLNVQHLKPSSFPRGYNERVGSFPQH